MKDKSIDGKLVFSQNALQNATNNQFISKALGTYGFDQKRMQEGMALYKKAEELNFRQHQEYDDQFEATDALKTARAETNQIYMKHLKLARIAFKGSDTIASALKLNGSRALSYTGWLGQTKLFYQNALSKDNIKTGLALMGITEKMLEEAYNKVLDVESKYNTQQYETGEAQDTTKERDKAFDELEDWMSDFIAVSRIALEDKPQYMEMLGVVVKD
jgi:hypothetical protein